MLEYLTPKWLHSLPAAPAKVTSPDVSEIDAS